jgi:peptidoglycan hydrolase-like protein with peptidoglycan-binding domain
MHLRKLVGHDVVSIVGARVDGTRFAHSIPDLISIKEGPAMKTRTLVTALIIAAALSTTPVLAQPRAYVEEMQKALRAQGHDPGPIDGVIGPQTEAALRAYQKQHGLEETGRPNDPTLTKLGESTTASASASPSMEGDGQPATDGAAERNSP